MLFRSNLRDGSGNSISSTGGHLNVNIADPLPAGSNAIGSVLADLRVASNPVSASNPVPVTISSATPGTSILDHKTSAALASAASVNLDYTVTAGKTLSFAGAYASASGKIKLELKIETGVATGVFNNKYVGFNSTANPNIDIWRNPFYDVAAGVRVRAKITNLDNQSQDVYFTLEGNEY